jgi:hypothetical protein
VYFLQSLPLAGVAVVVTQAPQLAWLGDRVVAVAVHLLVALEQPAKETLVVVGTVHTALVVVVVKMLLGQQVLELQVVRGVMALLHQLLALL